MILVTGGAGFIGSNFVLDWLAGSAEPVLNLDALTYAGNRENLATLASDPRHHFVHGDIVDGALLDGVFADYRPRAVVHFAAETHVDRSIHSPAAFVRTNVQGTFVLLEAAKRHSASLAKTDRESFRFVHVSTDEVYGSLSPNDPAFTEKHPYAPNNPYSASKAASDHLVRSWHHTYGLPVLTAHCTNNFGPLQFPDKLIPRTIVNALAGEPLQVFGDGQHVRDWLYVRDHCTAIRAVLAQGKVGETYNIGGRNEMPNLEIVQAICALLDGMKPDVGGSYRRLITHVADRPGHDRRYAVDGRKIEQELGWRPAETLESAMRKTVRWYLDNGSWTEHVRTGAYRDGLSAKQRTHRTAEAG